MKTNNQSQPGVVKKMREIRDELGIKFMHMTFEEIKAFHNEMTDKSIYRDCFEKQE